MEHPATLNSVKNEAGVLGIEDLPNELLVKFSYALNGINWLYFKAKYFTGWNTEIGFGLSWYHADGTNCSESRFPRL